MSFSTHEKFLIQHTQTYLLNYATQKALDALKEYAETKDLTAPFDFSRLIDNNDTAKPDFLYSVINAFRYPILAAETPSTTEGPTLPVLALSSDAFPDFASFTDPELPKSVAYFCLNLRVCPKMGIFLVMHSNRCGFLGCAGS